MKYLFLIVILTLILLGVILLVRKFSELAVERATPPPCSCSVNVPDEHVNHRCNTCGGRTKKYTPLVSYTEPHEED